MNYLLLLLALLLAALPATAQNSLSGTQSESLLAAQAAPDTVAAIHRLFAARRKRTALVAGLTVATGLGCAAIARDARHSYDINLIPVLAIGVGMLSIPAVAVEAGYYSVYTRRKEQRAVAAFEAHKLPERIKRRLRPAYFEAIPSR